MKQGQYKNIILALTYILIVVLDTYTNLVKYLQRVPLDVFINWLYLMQALWRYRKKLFRNIEDESILKVLKSKHLEAHEK